MSPVNSTDDVVQIGSCGIATYLKSLPTANIVTTNTVTAVLDSFLSVFTVITNALFIRTYRKTRELQNTSNMLLVVLATSDMLVGCLAEPLHITRATMEIYGNYSCFFVERKSSCYDFLQRTVIPDHHRYNA